MAGWDVHALKQREEYRINAMFVIMEIQPMTITNESSVITVETISGNGTSSPARTLGVDVMVTSSEGVKNSVVAVSIEGFEEES